MRPGLRESTRWVEGYERVAEKAADVPETRLGVVGDRESDMVEMMRRASAINTPADWLVRAKHDRCLAGDDGVKQWAATKWASSVDLTFEAAWAVVGYGRVLLTRANLAPLAEFSGLDKEDRESFTVYLDGLISFRRPPLWSTGNGG